MSNVTQVQSFVFGSKQIEYELSFQERKTLGIKVFPDCSVKVIAPEETLQEKIQLKLREKAPWILKQQAEFLSYYPLTPARKYISGETHLYLGRQYTLRVISSETNEIKLLKGQFIVYRNEKTSAKSLMSKWYREKAEFHFIEIFEKALGLFRTHGIEKPELSLRQMSNRWGSCTAKGKVILNPELIKAPKTCIEYVIIHELCHLIHHNHTRSFYALQESIMPDWKKWKERLEMLLT
jgi:predicted metal-dependent hydrolase